MTAPRFKFDVRAMARHLGILLAVWALLNVGFFLLGTRPKMKEFNSLDVGTAPQREALQRRRGDVEALEGFVDAVEQARRDLDYLRSDVLSTRERRLIEVQLEVTDLAGKFGIDVNSITFDNDLLGDEALDKLVMEVPLEGGYANLRRFLQAVEESDKFLIVERVALGEGKEGGVLLELKITLATYFDAPEERARNERRERQRALAGSRRG